MATRIKMSELEQRIMDRVFLSPDGFERVEDLLAATGADRNLFVDALETLEGQGYLSVASIDGSVVVASDDPIALLALEATSPGTMIYSPRVGHC